MLRHLMIGLHGPLFDSEHIVSAITAEIAANRGAAVSSDWVHQHVSGKGSKDKFRAIAKEANRAPFTEGELAEMREEHRVAKDGIGPSGKLVLVKGASNALTGLPRSWRISALSTDPLEMSQANLKKVKWTRLAPLLQLEILSGGGTPPSSYTEARDLERRIGERVFGPRENPEPFPGLDPSAARFADILKQASAASRVPMAESVVIDDAETGMAAGRAIGAGLVLAWLDPRFTGARAQEKKASLLVAGADEVFTNYRHLRGIVAEFALTLQDNAPAAAPDIKGTTFRMRR